MTDNETNDDTDTGATGGQASTGGQATGGQATGGQPAGGQATSGQATGGQATGGQATGGQPGGATHGATGVSDLEPNVAGALCYVLGWLSGLFFFFTEEEDEFVRFHAAQSIVAFGGLTVVYIVLNQLLVSMLFSAPSFGMYEFISLLNTLLMLAGLGLWIGLMYMAYQGRWYELPIAGDVANNLISNEEVTVERKATGD